ncbi:MAG TPA: alpha/beta hydrolase [Candidatus Angelobacter sp.]|nr:alpha/beta hydrolase [Candidatus Angelobacter sp.]
MKTKITRSSKLTLVLLVGAMLSQAFAQSKESGKPGFSDHPMHRSPDAPMSAPSFAVKVSGHGAPVIFIPGLLSSGDTWTTTVAHFQDRYTCHVLTLAGFAGQPPIHAPFMATVSDDLAAYIEQHHLKNPVIVGHSLGGDIAMDLAAHHPALVGPVVIVDSLPFMAGAWFQVKTVAEAKPMIDQMHAYMQSQSKEQYDQFVRSGAATKYMVTSPADLEVIKQWGLASDPATVSNAMAELLGHDLRADLSKIVSPVLVLGTWSGLSESLKQNGINITREQIAATFQQQYAGVPHLHFAMADKARHFIMWDDPKWFFQQLEDFLARPAMTAQDRGFKGE